VEDRREKTQRKKEKGKRMMEGRDEGKKERDKNFYTCLTTFPGTKKLPNLQSFVSRLKIKPTDI
jgi:hypothetical protein